MATPKVAVVLALLLKSDYPETWTDAFDQLQSLLVVREGAAHVDLYLRVLCALDEEVVTFHVDRSRGETEHNSLIKVGASTERALDFLYSLCLPPPPLILCELYEICILLNDPLFLKQIFPKFA